MSAAKHTTGSVLRPLTFLEEGEWAEDRLACRPLNLGDSEGNDVATIYSRNDSTVETTREEAVAYARLFVAASDLLEVAQLLAAFSFSSDIPLGVIQDKARAAIARATGEAA